ncbi:MAG TPA: hypothetical protein VL135_09175, partial [Terracidiphilus sp.]|nr:hypothetical protein [Terracidiphilus sp.]
QVGNKAALKTRMTTKTSAQQDADQVVYLYTVARSSGLWYTALAGQTSKMNELDLTFRQMVDTIQFPD